LNGGPKQAPALFNRLTARDADADIDLSFRLHFVVNGQGFLDSYGTFHGLACGGKGDHETITGVLNFSVYWKGFTTSDIGDYVNFGL